MARAALNLTVADLAAMAHVAANTVNRFETGKAQPIPATLAAIQRALEAAGVRFTETGVELSGISEKAS